jgi:hypothetical protein
VRQMEHLLDFKSVSPFSVNGLDNRIPPNPISIFWFVTTAVGYQQVNSFSIEEIGSLVDSRNARLVLTEHCPDSPVTQFKNVTLRVIIEQNKM